MFKTILISDDRFLIRRMRYWVGLDKVNACVSQTTTFKLPSFMSPSSLPAWLSSLFPSRAINTYFLELNNMTKINKTYPPMFMGRGLVLKFIYSNKKKKKTVLDFSKLQNWLTILEYTWVDNRESIHFLNF